MPRTVERCKGKPGATAGKVRTVTTADCPDFPQAAQSAAALWEQFKRAKSPQRHSTGSCHPEALERRRNALVERYMPVVRIIAKRIASEPPGSVQVDDLISAGTFGLMDAIERYDPELGTRFETYCALRIRGAILDELRHLNWMPRLQRTRAAKVLAASDALKGEIGRAPTAGEIARRAGIEVRHVETAPRSGSRHLSLSAAVHGEEGEDEMHRVDIIEADAVCDPAQLVQEKERRDLLAREIRELPRPQRLLVMLYYFDELTMKQIGQVLRVTESRVCQMHADILARLERRLGEPGERISDKKPRISPISRGSEISV